MCRNPQRCAALAHAQAKYHDLAREQGQRELDLFRSLPGDRRRLVPSVHADIRQVDRGFLWRHIAEVVLEEGVGEVVERRVERDGSIHLLIMGWVKTRNSETGKTQYRPIHVAVAFSSQSFDTPDTPWLMKVVTVYDPSDPKYRHRWKDHFSRRVCWCPVD